MISRVSLIGVAVLAIASLAPAGPTLLPEAAADHQPPCQITGDDPVQDTVCFAVILVRCITGIGPCPL